MTSRPFLRKNHKFKRGLKDKWCISNVSLDNALLDGKFIEIIMLIKLVVIFLLA
ncbi:hypothetical protein N444_00465 [Escherichia coli O6:H16:CFA/II str. B2C]|jgi:hypothetical protein|nr:hypothetical protein FORC31_1502 [Escherichia coli]EFK26969.1 hypothetical protein HMPREF9550_00901 [Escherichia coli MS 187-1]EMX31196.1 hypothetical protein ECMP0215612_3083 [Escherichia coli MP021561.2]ENA78519.1 hypothetical protein EC2730450_2611 [Escherichia coli 2730450]ENG04149.1 hypothetical protein ECP03052604_2520 [Escherichia coli P0305260.4]ETS29188.1 hypothetical protein N444_00465 [Escherichia coli O6:H16:CFA/II str. B2C]KDX87351.1 hypothetical protein AC99_3907 [Escherichia